MKWIRIAAAVLNQTPLAWEQNSKNIRTAIQMARQADASVLCLPELCVTGYGCEDAFLSAAVQQEALSVVRDLLPETHGMVVSFGLPLEFRGGLYNAAGLAADGQLLGFVAKQNLAGEGLHYEPRWFKPWPNGVSVTWTRDDLSVPLGDLVFDCAGVRIGFEICEDAWVANRPGIDLASRGVDVLLNPSASHFAFGKHQIRRRFVLDGSRAFHMAYVYANLLGNESGRAIFDGDAMIASCGQMLVTGSRFSYADVQLTHAAVDIDLIRTQKIRSHSHRPDPTAAATRVITSRFPFPEVATPATPCENQTLDDAASKYEEFTQAVSLGLFDYLRKSRSRGFVVSLSGGADSAAVSCLVANMIDSSVAELGLQGLKDKLAYDSNVIACQSVAELKSQLLTCVYQSTRNSSEVTLQAAQEVARATQARFLQLDVDPLVQTYTTMISQAVDRTLTWEQDDVALQNIQARVRGPSVWMLANLSGALLLATSNRSEAAVGYATMDGDTCGGLAPIAGIDKAFLREWLRWMESDGPASGRPLPALRFVNEQSPTAELRPQSKGQTDESDLMPYEILDSIERSAIRDKRGPAEVLTQLQADYPQATNHELLTWVTKFFQLWSRNQWKRERFAPAFHLDDENLDPKTWCRFPILSGGFQRELDRLNQAGNKHG